LKITGGSREKEMNIRQFIGLLLIVLGVISFFLSRVFAYFDEVRINYISGTYYIIYPYAGYALPLAIIGMVLLFVGVFFVVVKVERTRKTETEKPYLPPPPTFSIPITT
jgi:uncharacterized membrane protein